jgi:hypothetical protein
MMPDVSLSPGRISHWKIVLFAILFLTIVAAGLEFGVRYYLQETRGYDGEHLYQFAFDPYKNILPSPNYVDTRGIRHNSKGFRRSTEVSVAKSSGAYRIFLMGGSTAYGTGGLWPHIDDKYAVLKNSETIDAYLEQALSSALSGRKVEVINAAITSTWTHHNLIYLNQTILKYNPDMVLFLDGFNDYYYYDEGHDQFASYSYNLPSEVILGEPTIYSLAYASGWWLFRKSALAHMLGRGASNLSLLLSHRPVQHPIDVERALSVHQRNFSANALKMEERCGLILHNEQVFPVFMLQPMLILERDRKLTDVERRLFDFNVKSYLPNYEAFITRAVQYVRTRETEMASRVGGAFIDLTGIFKTVDGQIYTDYTHLTPEGNKLAALSIAEHILPIIRQRTAQPARPL